MTKSLLDKNFHLLVPFDMVFNSVHMNDYDPLAVIEEFWRKYNINDNRDHVVCLLFKALGKPVGGVVAELHNEELNEFSLELMHVLVAYYIVHSHKISLAELDIPILPKGKITEEELKFRQINNLLFGTK
jgi:hypothetical protein